MKFPMASLSSLEVETRGAHHSMVHVDGAGRPRMMAVLWVDKDRRYFNVTTFIVLPGSPWARVRLCEKVGGAGRVPISVPQPEVSELHYGCCAQIDRNNRCRHYVHQLERKLRTHDWSMRVNITLLGICIMDAWLLYLWARGAAAVMSQASFYEQLASGFIDNDSTREACTCKRLVGLLHRHARRRRPVSGSTC